MLGLLSPNSSPHITTDSTDRWHGFAKNLAWIGMTAPFTFISQLFEPIKQLPKPLSLIASPYLGFLAVCIIVLIIFRYKDKAPSTAMSSSAVRLLDLTSLIFLLLSIILAIPDFPITFSFPFITVGIMLGGTGVAWMYIRWGVLHAHLDIRKAIGIVCVSVILSGFLKVLLAVSPNLISSAIDITLVFTGFIFLRYCTHNVPRYDLHDKEADHRIHTMRDLWAFLLALVVLCGALGVLYSTPHSDGEGYSTLLGYILESLAALCVFWALRNF